jgi:hypothetical protein
MSELAITTPPQREPTYQVDKLPAKNGRTLRITRRVRAAVDAMVWQGLKRDEAAQAAGLKDNSLYVAFSRPDVKAYYLSQCEVLRVSGRARRIHRLDEISEQNTNLNAAVAAIKAAELVDEDRVGSGASAPFSGVVVNIITAAPAAKVIDNE